MSEKGFEVLKQLEGFVPTIQNNHLGYGFNLDVWGDELGETITEQEADQFLRQIVTSEYEPIVRAGLNRQVSQNEFDALVMFVYNTGVASPTLFNSVNAEATDLEFVWTSSYVTVDGVLVPGLQNRRSREYEYYSQKSGYLVPVIVFLLALIAAGAARAAIRE